MGLDMLVYARDTAPPRAVDFDPEPEEQQLFYWRKHPNLHGWMQRLYQDKGGESDQFNGDPVVLTLVDLVRLEATVQMRLLPETSGFFFGASDGSADEVAEDMDFIGKARAAIAEGKTVYYTSSW